MAKLFVKNNQVFGLMLFIFLIFFSSLQADSKLGDSVKETNLQLKKLISESPGSLIANFVFISLVLAVFSYLLSIVFRKIWGKKEHACYWGAVETAFFGFFFILWNLAIYGIAYSIFSTKIEEYFFKLILYWFTNGSFCLILLLSLRSLHAVPWEGFGMRIPSLKESLGAVSAYILFLPWYLFAFIFSHVLFIFFGLDPKSQQVAEELLGSGGMTWWIGVITVVVVAPITEEFVFRIFLYKGIRKISRVSVAIVFSAVIFALMHQNMLAFLPICSLGIFLALLYEKSGSFWLPVLAHLCHNGFTLVYLLYFLK